MPPDVTVSIVNHESREAVLAGLAALRDDPTRRATLQLIVVDNVSQDGSAEAIREALPEVEVVRDGRRRGFGANHNRAIARAQGRYVLLLNDDTIVRPGAIDALVAHLDAHPEAAIAGPVVADHGGRGQPSAWPQPSPARDALSAITLGRALGTQSGDRARPVGWVMGCAMLARREDLEAVGGFDERYFMYSEEIDLSRRLADRGRETHFVPSAEVVHEGQASTGGHGGAARAVEMARSRRLFWEAHYGAAGQLVARVVVGLMFAVLALITRARGGDAAAFALQARGSWGEPRTPGLRERAEAFNRAVR